MQNSEFERWIRQIYDTREDEISCSDCFDRVSQYTDLAVQVAGAEPLPCLRQGEQPCPVCGDLPCLRQHLLQCRVCREEYETLRDLTRGQTDM